ncbi:MAG: hypothetical protein JO015_11510 [Verrucomicrobia bacterium]|nr:hypothetical protein [Verrucomicrobiota bacterium]
MPGDLGLDLPVRNVVLNEAAGGVRFIKPSKDLLTLGAVQKLHRHIDRCIPVGVRRLARLCRTFDVAKSVAGILLEGLRSKGLVRNVASNGPPLSEVIMISSVDASFGFSFGIYFFLHPRL